MRWCAGSYSQMVPTTTLDDYLLPRMKLKRDDAFEAHMKVLLWPIAHIWAMQGSDSLLRLCLREELCLLTCQVLC